MTVPIFFYFQIDLYFENVLKLGKLVFFAKHFTAKHFPNFDKINIYQELF